MKTRCITTDEKELIEMILKNLEGSNISLPQSEKVEELDQEGSLRFSNTIITPHKYVPVEAEFIDDDGISVHALIFVKANVVDELEIYKDDGSPIVRRPKPRDWKIINLESAWKKKFG